MKTATLPPVRVLSEFRTEIEFLQTAVRDSVRPSPDHLSRGTQEKSIPFDICNNAPSFSPERGWIDLKK